MIGLTESSHPYRPDGFLDVDQIMWRNIQVFIGPSIEVNGNQSLEVAFLLTLNFPTEEKYEETLTKCSEIVGPEFTISSGETENLEIWMSYIAPSEGNEFEIIEKIQRASDIALQILAIATGLQHVPEIKLK